VRDDEKQKRGQGTADEKGITERRKGQRMKEEKKGRVGGAEIDNIRPLSVNNADKKPDKLEKSA